ncbi:hypothetical protein [Nonlabens xylanidelens]|uniref:hypothetical protein n=1 Tax=Nonlabens xylanidelens TaxID=191564 RepID=UPI000CF4A004|nr:hypothetical protein [Nonlabens xylanidelens]PQJ14339.1 hypothetical protein BST94_12650 [Nonlabens xylanidelens]
MTTTGSNPESMVTVVAGATTTTVDDGYQGSGDITGFVYEDVDGDGVYDPLVDMLFPAGTVVELTDEFGNLTITTVDAFGNGL